jgi:hypothetical protein
MTGVKDTFLTCDRTGIINIAPIPKVLSDEEIKILDHHLIDKDGEKNTTGEGVAITLKNTAGSYINKAVIDTVFYDLNGNILEHKLSNVMDLDKDKIQSLCIYSSNAAINKVRSYDIRIAKVMIVPIPTVIGDDRIKILKHALRELCIHPRVRTPIIIDFSIKNITDITIATAIFEVVFYDGEGNVLDTVRHKVLELKSKSSRAIVVESYNIPYGMVKSYRVTLVKTITVEIEKVQLIRSEIRKSENGTEEILGVVKNISDFKTDIALVATLIDLNDEIIEIKVLHLKNIEAGKSREFRFICGTHKEEKVKSYSIDIGEVVEENK